VEIFARNITAQRDSCERSKRLFLAGLLLGFQNALKRSNQVQGDLWQQSIAVVQQSPTPITSLFIQSFNETIDLDAKRLAALENRIPRAIWGMLVFLSVLTCLMVGTANAKDSFPRCSYHPK
jgi:hypothetical protein